MWGIVDSSKAHRHNEIRIRMLKICALWCSDYHYCATSFNKFWTQVLRRFKSCSRWSVSLTMVPAGNKAKRSSSVNHTSKTIHSSVCRLIQSFYKYCLERVYFPRELSKAKLIKSRWKIIVPFPCWLSWFNVWNFTLQLSA